MARRAEPDVATVIAEANARHPAAIIDRPVVRRRDPEAASHLRQHRAHVAAALAYASACEAGDPQARRAAFRVLMAFEPGIR
jgi:hypothetical protein